jgi:pyridoxal 5'-phosphate synthase pdxT subunit
MVRKFEDIKVGVLSLQGAFKEHIIKLGKCGVSAVEIRFPWQLEHVDGLIIPGGESTTINKLLKEYNFKESLDRFYKEHKPIFGTCAGLILLAREIQDEGNGLGYIDIIVRRNAYGRQVDSFEEPVHIDFNGNGKSAIFNSIFIRAPKIVSIGKDVKVMAQLNGEAILVKNDNVMVSAFHPELTDDIAVHSFFVNMIRKHKGEC